MAVQNGSRLAVRLYRKPINAYGYLHLASEHPKTCYKFVRGEAIRFVRCCAFESDFRDCLSFFTNKLIQRGYP